MKASVKSILFTAFILLTSSSFAQPIPVEWMIGNRYSTINMVVSKGFLEASRFGFFHISTIQVDYKSKLNNDFMMQDLLFYEPIKNIRITAGAFYGQPGFIPAVGLQM